MDLALSIAKSGLEAHHKKLEIISNNLANVNTGSFKKNRGEFTDLAYQVLSDAGAPTSDQTNTTSGLIVGTGTKLVSNKKIFSQGSLIQTDKPLDVAIQGRGFLKVQQPNGSDYAYTRDGSLSVNPQGQITLHNGYVVQPPITIPPGTQKIEVGPTGMVSVSSGNSGTVQQIGQLQLTDFNNPEGLEPMGDNLYRSTQASGQPTDGNPQQNGLGELKQFFLEGSNVNVVEEMVDMIESQRAFEITSKAVSAADNMLHNVAQET